MPWQPAYVTTAELKSYLRIPITDTDDDAELDFAIEAASRAVDQATNRQFGQLAAVEARLYTAEFWRNRCRWVIEIDDLMTETGLLINIDDDDDDVFDKAIDDFRLAGHGFNFNAATVSRPWIYVVVGRDTTNFPTNAEARIEVTARWGWTTVPDTVKQATLLQASRFFARRNAPFGVAGSPEMESEIRLLAKADPDVKVALRPYRRWWAAR